MDELKSLIENETSRIAEPIEVYILVIAEDRSDVSGTQYLGRIVVSHVV